MGQWVARPAENIAVLLDRIACFAKSRGWHPGLWNRAPLARLSVPVFAQSIREVHWQESKADAWLVHNVFPVASGGVYKEALRQRIPIIYYIHNFRPFSVNGSCWVGDHIEPAGLRGNLWPEVRAGSWRESRLETAVFAGVLKTMHRLGWFQAIKAWVAISDFMRNKFIEAGVPEEDIFTIHHFWIPHGDPDRSEDGGYYLYLGRLIEQKGIRTLIEVWHRLRKELGPKTPTLKIGGYGALEEWVKEQAERHPNIEFLGLVSGEPKERLLREARAMVVPSVWWEPLGLVVYEAYDNGKPIFSSDAGGLAETVFDGETGFVHRAGDVEQLTEQILEFERNPGSGKEMGRRGREWLLANTSKEQWLEKFKKVVGHAVGGTGEG